MRTALGYTGLYLAAFTGAMIGIERLFKWIGRPNNG